MEANLLEEKRAVEGMMGRFQCLWRALVSQPLASDTNELGELGEFGSAFWKSGGGTAHGFQRAQAQSPQLAAHTTRSDAIRYCSHVASRNTEESVFDLCG